MEKMRSFQTSQTTQSLDKVQFKSIYHLTELNDMVKVNFSDFVQGKEDDRELNMMLKEMAQQDDNTRKSMKRG